MLSRLRRPLSGVGIRRQMWNAECVLRNTAAYTLAVSLAVRIRAAAVKTRQQVSEKGAKLLLVTLHCAVLLVTLL